MPKDNTDTSNNHPNDKDRKQNWDEINQQLQPHKTATLEKLHYERNHIIGISTIPSKG